MLAICTIGREDHRQLFRILGEDPGPWRRRCALAARRITGSCSGSWEGIPGPGGDAARRRPGRSPAAVPDPGRGSRASEALQRAGGQEDHRQMFRILGQDPWLWRPCSAPAARRITGSISGSWERIPGPGGHAAAPATRRIPGGYSGSWVRIPALEALQLRRRPGRSPAARWITGSISGSWERIPGPGGPTARQQPGESPAAVPEIWGQLLAGVIVFGLPVLGEN